MKKIFTLICFLIAIKVIAADIISVNDGDWNDPNTWNLARVPENGDVVFVEHNVDVNCNCGVYTNMRIEINGQLYFNNGQKIRLDATGVIQINAGGSVDGGNGGSKIVIDGVDKWDATMGAVAGPAYVSKDVAGFTGGILPIELISFEAVYEEGKVLLRWATASEKNNEKFDLERSTNGFSFESIEEIEGAANSSSRLDYETYDAEPPTATIYYRLKQTDYDGNYSYSSLVVVNIEKAPNGDCVFKVYPNPCAPSCNFSLSDCEDGKGNTIQLEMYDATGNKIYQDVPYRSSNGSFQYQINTSNNFAPGVYIVNAGSVNENYSQKVVVK